MTQFKLIILTSLSLFTAACNKQLELAPENTLVDKDVFNTEAGSEQALAEAYNNLRVAATANISYTFGDFTTPILLHSSFYNTFTEGETSPSDEAPGTVWTNYFKAINTANNVIAKIPVFGNFSEEIENRFIAESKFIRAYAFLDLLKMFGDGALTGKMDGLGLPLQLTPFQGYNTGAVIPRSTNQQVYQQIIDDLNLILPLLPEQQPNELKTRSRATKGSANALLSRCLLYMKRYEEAGAAAKAVIDKQPFYAITTNLMQLFPANPNGSAQSFSSEYILGLPVSQMVSSSTSANNNIANGYFFKRSFWINPAFRNEFEQGDLRVSQLMFKGDETFNAERLNDYTTFKFNNSNGRDNVPLIRLAEIILIRAESLARTTGVTAEAVGLLNQIRSRSIPSATPFETADFVNADALIDKILLQRKYELAFEGFYRYDLLRTGKPLRSPDLPELKKVLPVPQLEIDISYGVIRQNPGYVL